MERRKILVVDDNPGNLKLFTLLLGSPRYQVETATTAQHALDVMAWFRPELLILDVQLPDLDGLELTRRLKADPERRGVLVVAVTAYAMKGDEERARAAGADGYMSKPLDKNAFRALVAEFLDQAAKDGGQDGN